MNAKDLVSIRIDFKLRPANVKNGIDIGVVGERVSLNRLVDDFENPWAALDQLGWDIVAMDSARFRCEESFLS